MTTNNPLLGPTTHPPTAIVLKALEFAKTQIGVIELAGNRGPKIKGYLATVGLNEGYSWCAAFVYWSFEQSAFMLKFPNPLIKTGGVLKHWNLTKGVKIKAPRTGDIFILEFSAGLGHTGFVKTVDLVAGTYTTVEGNSNSAGSRTGGMVCSNTRKISAAKGFIRY